MNEAILASIITGIIMLAGSWLVFIVAWRKSPSEIRKNDSDAGESEAQASATWAQSNQLAAQQIVELQRSLQDERAKRVELEGKLSDLEIKFNRHDNRIKRLEAQVISLGAEPVK